MGLFLVAGTSGTGKSSISLELRKRGFESYDTDDDGLARWQHTETGFIYLKSSVKAHQRTAQFISENDWNVPREFVEILSNKAVDHPIFLCGSISNELVLRDLFTNIFALYVDDQTLKVRLQTRTNNDWGKQSHELEQSLAANSVALQKYTTLGYVVIDASMPTMLVADDILQKAQLQPKNLTRNVIFEDFLDR